ncbi:MAG: hypothetical protein CVU81_00425 [Euryarchaeota archaeon HGW-Euryarchaeota-1]|nr:MAG: hypothetical protein CVU81_00425 [Euryarchaeota archaeon HGW-Euryarchaeota-1]
MFSESAGRFVISLKEENKTKFENLMKGINFANIGFVRKDRKFIVKGNEGKEEKEIINVDIDELRDAWKTPLNG